MDDVKRLEKELKQLKSNKKEKNFLSTMVKIVFLVHFYL